MGQPRRACRSLGAPLHADSPSHAGDAVAKGYQEASRGRLVMPCGTGKSLLAMWARNRGTGHVYVGVCSDKTTGRRSGDGDTARHLAELPMPVSTDRAGIAQALAQPTGNKMQVVFSTYQSLPVLASALPKDFALVVCDEAHRTTGVDRLTDDEVSAFRLIHDDKAVPAKFRLFMTATQRIYTAAAKSPSSDQGQRHLARHQDGVCAE